MFLWNCDVTWPCYLSLTLLNVSCMYLLHHSHQLLPSTPHHQPATPHHQPATPHHQPAKPHHQPAKPHHQPATPHHQPATPQSSASYNTVIRTQKCKYCILFIYLLKSMHGWCFMLVVADLLLVLALVLFIDTWYIPGHLLFPLFCFKRLAFIYSNSTKSYTF